MAGGFAAPQFVIVKGRQIIMDKGVGVDHFKGACRWKHSMIIHTHGLICCHAQGRPYTFAAGFHGIPYRFIKKFSGKVIKEGKESSASFTFNVRYKNRPANVNLDRMESLLLEKGIMKELRLGSGRMLLVGARDFFKEGMKQLDKDIHFFLKEKPKKSMEVIFR